MGFIFYLMTFFTNLETKLIKINDLKKISTNIKKIVKKYGVVILFTYDIK